MRIVLRALWLTGLTGAVALTLSASALGASTAGPSGWRIATTVGAASG